MIGISGSPEEVRPFCNIVRTTVSLLLIEQRNTLENLANEANRKKAMLEMRLAHQGAYSQKLRKEAAAYNIDLLLKTTVLYLKHFNPEKDAAKLLLRYPSFQLDEDSWLLLIQNRPDCSPLIAELLHNQPLLLLASGRLEPSIAEGYLRPNWPWVYSLR